MWTLTNPLDHVYFGCNQRECKPNETIIEQYTKMFESRISAGATEKPPGWENFTQRRLRGLRHGRTSSKMRCANKKVEQLYKVSHPCLDDPSYVIHFTQLIDLLFFLVTCWVLVLESETAPVSWWLACLG